MHSNDLAVEDGGTRRAVEDGGRGFDRLAGGGRGGGARGSHVLRLRLADYGARGHHTMFYIGGRNACRWAGLEFEEAVNEEGSGQKRAPCVRCLLKPKMKTYLHRKQFRHLSLCK